MNALLLGLLYTCGILLYGNGLPYGDLFSRYETRDDYYEDYYLRKIPEPKTSVDKVKEFIINHLSWFPVDDLENEFDGDRRHQMRRSDEIWNEIFVDPCELPKSTDTVAPTEEEETTTEEGGTTEDPCKTHKTTTAGKTSTTKKGSTTAPKKGTTAKKDTTTKKGTTAKKEGTTKKDVSEKTTTTQVPHTEEEQDMKVKVALKMKNFTSNHHMPSNWTCVKNKSCESIHKLKDYAEKKHFKEVMKNVTHPLRYRGPKNHTHHCDPCDCKCIANHHHPKSSHVEKLKPKTTTPFPYEYECHFAMPRRIRTVRDLKETEKPKKLQKSADEKTPVNVESDNNSTHMLETAGEMASDLAGKVTSLWHSVVGQHHEKTLPDHKDIRFYLYTRRNIIRPELLKVNYELIDKKIRENSERMDVECIDLTPDQIGEFERISDENRDIIRSNFLNLKAPTKILIHGYTGSYKDSRMAKIKDAYLTNGRYNVIQVDWEALAAPPCYIKVTHHSKFVGETIAQLLNGLYLVGLNMSLVHLVGFSLGAQVAGFTGNNATIVPVCRITGLDPALPLFLHTAPAGHLDKLDAKFVDVIHTCGGILAMLDPLGHVDFYPNGGTRQPGCEFSNLKCSHSRAPQYFAESIISQKKFTGQLCLNWDEYVAGNCNNVTDVSFMGEPCSRKSIPGKYYLTTKSKEPFVL